jgi:MPBQ/MSBQ methyltransferase
MPLNSKKGKANYKALLKIINADSLGFVLPKEDTAPDASNRNEQRKYFDYIHNNPTSTQAMYGENDLAKFPMFSGGYINFGFWKGIPYKNIPLTEEKRIQSSINLYQHIFKQLNIDSQSTVLEVGSGQGNGCILLTKQFFPKWVVGLDAVAQQTERAKQRHSDFLKLHQNVEFATGLAEKIPFQDDSFTHIISVEAASHFSSMKDFFREANRVLKPNGSLLVTTVFPKNHKALETLKHLLPKYHVYMNDFTIDKIPECTTDFKNVKITKIGDHVWEGLDEWLKRDDLKKSWSRLWLKAYEADLIDYYIVEANTLSLEEKLKNQAFSSIRMGRV